VSKYNNDPAGFFGEECVTDPYWPITGVHLKQNNASHHGTCECYVMHFQSKE